MIFFGLIPPSVLFLLAVFLPESPIWRQDKKEKKKMNLFPQLKKILFTWKVIWRMLLCNFLFLLIKKGFVLIMSLHFGGLVPVIVYLPITIRSAGLSNFFEITFASIGIALWNSLTALSTVLFVDCFGRKILLAFGYTIMFFSTLTFGFIVMFVPAPYSGIVSIVLALIFLIGNNGGINSIIYFIFNELHDKDVVIVTNAINVTLLYFISFVIGWTYLPLKNFIGLPATLWMFSASTLITGVFLMIFLPETKAKIVKEVVEKVEQTNPASDNGTELEGEPSSTELEDVEPKEKGAMGQLEEENEIDDKKTEFQSINFKYSNDLEEIE
jgi:hypothetical protein